MPKQRNTDGSRELLPMRAARLLGWSNLCTRGRRRFGKPFIFTGAKANPPSSSITTVERLAIKGAFTYEHVKGRFKIESKRRRRVREGPRFESM
jgi:hypothetical protein